MTLEGKVVRFWLSASGKAELPEWLQREPLDALVVEEDQLGVWIAVAGDEGALATEGLEVVLLKWEHFSTALTSYEVQQPSERQTAGFTH